MTSAKVISVLETSWSMRKVLVAARRRRTGTSTRAVPGDSDDRTACHTLPLSAGCLMRYVDEPLAPERYI